MSKIKNKQWQLMQRPVGRLGEENFKWEGVEMPNIEAGQILLKTQYLSLDPANRGWTNAGGSYRGEIPLGSVMEGLTISEVVASKNDGFAVGDTVQSYSGWQEHEISDGKGLTKLPEIPGVPITAYMGVMGMVGLTAYFGLLDIGAPKEGETLVVSAGAGAVGSLVGQIGKIKGCRVVGIAGTDEKVAWMVNDLGFDAGINYKTENVRAQLKTHCPDGIDIYFENVGGKILDDVLSQINNFARIPLCGLISMYNATEPVPGPYYFANILTKRVKVQGFIVTDFYKRYMEGVAQLGQWLMEGKLQYRVDIVDGLENAPTALNKLFDGTNKGKLIIKVS
jgi:NADPH-dependent curcumin reductase CurA